MNRHVVAGVLGLALALAGCMSDRAVQKRPGPIGPAVQLDAPLPSIHESINQENTRIDPVTLRPDRPPAASPQAPVAARGRSSPDMPGSLPVVSPQTSVASGVPSAIGAPLPVPSAQEEPAGQPTAVAEQVPPGSRPRADEPGAPLAGPASVAEAESTPTPSGQEPSAPAPVAASAPTPSGQEPSAPAPVAESTPTPSGQELSAPAPVAASAPTPSGQELAAPAPVAGSAPTPSGQESRRAGSGCRDAARSDRDPDRSTRESSGLRRGCSTTCSDSTRDAERGESRSAPRAARVRAGRFSASGSGVGTVRSAT